MAERYTQALEVQIVPPEMYFSIFTTILTLLPVHIKLQVVTKFGLGLGATKIHVGSTVVLKSK